VLVHPRQVEPTKKKSKSIYEGKIFFNFVYHVEISQTMVALATLLVPLESP